ncbi:DUF3238 domain-containing protein [Paenibacillus oenotherae]|uniref:DUF3238 domain-containing protein n=1 Tax=Paenibacillus oenotherae TaxID=1435645 RepID=A0ABS7D917_9BACL|nr:RHS repeat-associated core domain-containing protein [Paenibacillus oenotherae]MBW7476076.1 DUF3238 domain-containing protein [Paenibacillus oenotherae]
MRIRNSKIILAAIIIGMLAAVFEPMAAQRVYANESMSTFKLEIEKVVERFATTEPFVQQQLDQGYTLNEVYTAFLQAEIKQSTFQEELHLLSPNEINLSSTVTGQVYNDLTDPILRMVDAVKADESTIVAEHMEATERALEGKSGQNRVMATNATVSSIMQEVPPVYNKTTMNEAPYAIGLNNESISSLTGGLSVQQTDMSLPGRNGLGFSLTRTYDSNASQFYGKSYGVNNYTYDIYKYYVTFQAIEKPLIPVYTVKYTENQWIEEDYDGNGTVDYSTGFVASNSVTLGSYDTRVQADQAISNGVVYTNGNETRTQTDYRTSSSSTGFNSYVYYSANGFSGNLYSTGQSYVISGSYTPAASRTETDSCTKKEEGYYNSSKIWVKSSDISTCPYSISYASGGYSGTLNKINVETIKACESGGTPGWKCTREYLAHYSGIVTKPASADTRVYRQDYRGTVTKQGASGSIGYGSWQSAGSGYYRYARKAQGFWVTESYKEGQGSTVTFASNSFENQTDAYNFKNTINSYAGSVLKRDGQYIYYFASSPNATVQTYVAAVGQGVSYYNQTTTPIEQQMYPIGKGWSWSLPFIEKSEGKLFIHLAGKGSYEIDGSRLKGYDWEGMSFTTNTSVSFNGETSKYVLTSVDGTIKQYFTDDGRILQISDAYNNATQFSYTQHATYARKLLSEVTDAIGNKIQIVYTPSEVRLTKGSQSVLYRKHTEQGVEILDSVTDVIGRKTTYSYQLKEAKFNLFSAYPERGTSNPYALLTQVQHPTGSKTVYTYETLPVKRLIGSSSVNEAYRLQSRFDQIIYDNGSIEDFNRQSIQYHNTDIGSSYDQDMTILTTIDNGLTRSTFNYKKDVINAETPAQYYLQESIIKADGMEKKTVNTYGKTVGARNYPVSVPTVSVMSDNITGDTITVSNQYDDYGNTLQSTDAAGITTTYTYDPSTHLIKTMVKPVSSDTSLFTEYIRNPQRAVTQVTVRKNNAIGEILQQVSYPSYDEYGNVLKEVVLLDGRSREATFEYKGGENKFAFPTKKTLTVIDADNLSTTIHTEAEYDRSNGLMTAWIDGKQNRTAYEYDVLHRIKKVTYPGGAVFQSDYNDVSNTITVRNEVGSKARISWNSLGWKIKEELLEGSDYKRKASYGYDSNGRMIWSEDARSNRSQVAYDKWGRTTSTINADLAESKAIYNEALRTTTTIDAEGYTQIQTFDKLGRVVKQEERSTPNAVIKQVSSLVYHPISGQVTEQRDGNNNVTKFAYDALGQLSAVTNAKNETTSYTYDKVGNITKMTYPGGSVKEKFYDELGRVKQIKDEEGRLERRYYDANSNLVRRKDHKGNETTLAYDARNRLTNRTSANQSVTYTYDEAGKRLSMTDGTGTTAYSYDPYTEQLTTLTYPDQLKLQLEYDANGNREKMTGPFGSTTFYSYNNLNQLVDVGTIKGSADARYTYKKNGLLHQTIGQNGVTSNSRYDGLKLSELSHVANEEAVLTYKYAYDGNNNIANRTVNQQKTDSFTYDSLNRIETSSEFAETYTYDQRGNRLSMESVLTTADFEDRDITLDNEGRLTSIAKDRASVQYRYNGDGLMVERIQNDITTRYYYDGDQIIAEATVINGVRQLKANYIRGNRLEVISYSDGSKAYPVVNGHGDIVELRDASGNLLNKYEYDLWGNVVSEEEMVHNPFRYSGELWDSTTKLQYLRARWYNPSDGRFVSEDTYEGQIDNPLSLNLYTYVSNNPLIFTDPSGHMQESDVKYKKSNTFVYEQLEFLTEAYNGAAGSKAMQNQIHATANYLRFVADTGANYAIVSLDTFLPVDTGSDPHRDTYLGNGSDRHFGVNDLNVKTLQYGVVNLDYNSIVGFNYVTVTERIDDQGEVIASKRDSNRGMSWATNLDKSGDSNYTIINAVTSARNELSSGSPSLDYSVKIKISNMSRITVSGTLDKFPSYEGYISINGGNFNTLYQFSAIPAPVNPFINLAFSRGSFSYSFTYE